MSSSVFFKFKSSKDPLRITFDGVEISVFDLKREIIGVSGLGDGTNFDLSIYDEVTNEEFTEDTTMVKRSTTVIARRVPAARPGHGKAARYVSGRAPVVAKTTNKPDASGNPAAGNSDEARLAQLLDDAWTQQRQKMAEAKVAPRVKRNVPAGEPPATYVCHRCHQKGHWIQACPTNDDPNFSSRPKIPRTTGIPRSHLMTVEIETPEDDGLTDTSRAPANVMINANGDYVIARTDQVSWEKFQAKANASTTKQQTVEEAGAKEIRELGLQCALCKRLYVDPVKTSCCETTYCSGCIENALVNNDLVCPNCSEGSVLIDDLVPDQETIDKIKTYQTEKRNTPTPATGNAVPAEASTESAPDSTDPPAPSDNIKAEGTAPSPSVQNSKSGSSPTQGPAQSTPTVTSAAVGPSKPADSAPGSQSKKRPADEELVNTRASHGHGLPIQPPTGPAAMTRQNGGYQPRGPMPQQMNGQFNVPFQGNNMHPNGMMNPMMMMNQGMPWNGMMMPMGNMGMMNGNYPMGPNGMYNPMMQNQHHGQYPSGPQHHHQQQFQHQANGPRNNWNQQWNSGPNMAMGQGYGNMRQPNPQMYGAGQNQANNGPYNRPQMGGNNHGNGSGNNQISGSGSGNGTGGGGGVGGGPTGTGSNASTADNNNQAQNPPTQPSAFQSDNSHSDQGQNEEDSPYFRAPVNPSRHVNRRRLRRSDFTQLH